MLVSKVVCMFPVAGPGGIPSVPHPQRDPVLLFSHTFLLKSARKGTPGADPGGPGGLGSP